MSNEVDGMNCPRCGKSFTDVDIEKNPELFCACPHCGAIEHEECRGPLVNVYKVALLREAGDRAVKCFLKCMVESDLATGQDYAVLVISDKIRAAIMGEEL